MVNEILTDELIDILEVERRRRLLAPSGPNAGPAEDSGTAVVV